MASRVQRELEGLPHVTYRGAAYGAEKDAAYASMDALLFPTRYVNEAAPIVVYEALARGIPVIANRRGCVPDMLRAGGGVLQDEGSFVAGAVEQVVSWIHDPWSFRHASECALQGAAAAAAEEPTTTDRYVDWLTATGRPGRHGRTW